MFDETMKQTMKYAFAKGLFVAALATTFAACSTDDTTDQQPTAGKIKVSLQATMPETRSQITVDEENGRFSGAWDASDAMTVYANSEKAGFTFNADTKVFEGELTDQTTDWTYQAIYPRVGTDGAEHRIPFGAARTQNGSNFNGAYDPLVSEPVTHANSQPGKTPAGEAVTFGLQRLTSIIALTFTTDDAAVSKEKVQSVTLTAGGGEFIAAQTFDISRNDQTGTLSTEGQSSSITMSYKAGSEPAAAEFKAYFNVPAGDYGALTATIVTEGHTATVALTDDTTLTAGELAYKTTAVSAWNALAAAPTMEWVDHTPNADGTYPSEEITDPMSVIINIEAAAGIEGFIITIDSPLLSNEDIMGLSEIDLMDEVTYSQWKDMLNLPDPLKGKTDAFTLDLSTLVPLIKLYEETNPELTYNNHKFSVRITDALNRSIDRTLIFSVTPPPSITYNSSDLWAKSASLTLSNVPATASSVTVQYKASDEDIWHDATVSSDKKTATITPEWEGPLTTVETSPNTTVTPYYRMKAGTGIAKDKAYSYKLIVDGKEYIGSETFSATADPNGDIPSLDNSALSCYTESNNTNETWWASGNCTTSILMFTVKAVCCQYKESSAYLTSSYIGAAGQNMLSAGNLFTGKFNKSSLTKGDASFGIGYTWNTRPNGIKFTYKGAVATGTLRTKHKKDGVDPVTSADNDYARIYVAVVDWGKARTVSSGTSAPTGTWDPETVNQSTFEPEDVATYGGGKVIGYASYWIDKNNMPTDFTDKTLQFNWFDKEAKPADGNLSLVISCASNAYGDYMCGYDGNYMYIKDFEWVY